MFRWNDDHPPDIQSKREWRIAANIVYCAERLDAGTILRLLFDRKEGESW